MVIPFGVTRIGEQAFEWCDKLASITIPSSVTSIGAGAFLSCHALNRATFFGDAPFLEFDPDLPDFLSRAFSMVASEFTFNFIIGKPGFSTPEWEGHPATGIPATIGLWRLDYFGRIDNSGYGSDQNDFDEDGLPNLLEYAFGGNPRTDDAARICPSASLPAGQLQVSFQCDAYLTNINYDVQACANPATDSVKEGCRDLEARQGRLDRNHG